jgi:predicted ATPase
VPKINRVQIENYKSIERLDFEARRVNVFIGGPNAGKSNILEALALLGKGVSTEFKTTFRTKEVAELFHDQAIERTIRLQLNQQVAFKLSFDLQRGQFCLDLPRPGVGGTERWFYAQEFDKQLINTGDYSVRYYSYRSELFANGHSHDYGALDGPFGRNLPSVLFSDRSFRESVSALFKAHGHRLELRPQSSEILISKQVDDILYSYPFSAISETLRRIVFYKAVLETNQDKVLVLDEPEANTFPFYTKYLAERIALDESNQFFLTTHNPYVLMSIIEKTPKADLAVYVTRMKNYRTEIRLLTDAELGEALELGMDLFLNLDRYFAD